MKITLADKFIAYLALLSGLTISAVAIWYSVAGLVSIFAAAVTPIIVMGVALEISKLIATVWLKLNWSRAPIFIRSYLLGAIAILMVITSMGIFGFLSKAHSDQSLVSGDVQSKIAVYDEKIKTAKENIEADRKQLKQMDEAVDQVMGRSTDEKGADKANSIRRSQQRDRIALAKDIEANQKLIATLNDEAAPIRAEVRKVEAEVGPIKYIAAFIYGDNPDANVLEKAVTWVIIIIVSVFDPLAVILLLASQYSFQWFRKDLEEAENTPDTDVTIPEPSYEPDDGPLTEEQIEQLAKSVKDESSTDEPIPCHKCGTELIDAPGIGLFCPNKECDVFDNTSGADPIEFTYIPPTSWGTTPIAEVNDNQMKLDFDTPVTFNELSEADIAKLEAGEPLDQWNKMIEAAELAVAKEKTAEQILDEGLKTPTFQIIPELQKELKNNDFPAEPYKGQTFVDSDGKNFIYNGTDWINADWSDKDAVKNLIDIGEESKKKINYMIKEQDQQVLKTRE
jgi:hypothetical protein